MARADVICDIRYTRMKNLRQQEEVNNLVFISTNVLGTTFCGIYSIKKQLYMLYKNGEGGFQASPFNKIKANKKSCVRAKLRNIAFL